MTARKRPILSVAKPAPSPVKIVVPSRRRANMLTTQKAIDIDCVCVAESEIADYKAHNPGLEFVSHPDNILGLHAKRQWMYEHFGSIMMFDDDVSSVVRLYQGPIATKPSRVKPLEVRAIVNNLFQMVCDCDAYLFGFSKKGSPLAYRPFKPFGFAEGITGGACGMRAGSKLRYHPSMNCYEDDWISAMNFYHHRYAVIDHRYFAATFEYGTRRGGLTGFRNDRNLARDVEILKYVFGDEHFVPRSTNSGGGTSAKTIKTNVAFTMRAPW